MSNPFTLIFVISSASLYLLLLRYQAAQLTHILDERLKELIEDADWEKALKDVANAMAKEKGKAIEAAKKKAQSLEKARLLAEKKLAKVEAKLGGIELKLAEAKSLTLAYVDEIADLKAALEACENKWYNEGFADAENSVEPIVHQARFHGFGEECLATLQAMGVLEDSPLRKSEQIPYPAPSPPVQSQADTADKEDTPSMRELVRAIDTYVETVDLKVTNNLNATENEEVQQPSTEDVLDWQVDDVVHFSPTDPSV